MKACEAIESALLFTAINDLEFAKFTLTNKFYASISDILEDMIFVEEVKNKWLLVYKFDIQSGRFKLFSDDLLSLREEIERKFTY
jgi:hypothetical protein